MHSIESLKHIVDEMRASSRRVLEYSKNRNATGLHRERIVEAYLRKITPQSFDIGSGFIYDSEHPSRQVDILIYDKMNFSPLFDEGGYKVILPDSIVYTVEVKSMLNRNAMFEAFENIISVTSLNNNAHGSIFAFDGTDPETAFDNIQSYVSNLNCSSADLLLLPRMIVCLDKWVMVAIRGEDGSVSYTYSETKPFEEQFLSFFSEIYFTLYGYRRRLHPEGFLPLLTDQGFQTIIDVGDIRQLHFKPI